MMLRLELMGWMCLQEGGGSGHGWNVWTLRKNTYQWDSSSGSLI